jgi:hypothetical protein
MKRKQEMKQQAEFESKESKLSRAVKLAAAIAALGSTVGVDAGKIGLSGWLSPAGVEASQVKVEAAQIKLLPAVKLKNGQMAQIRGGQMFIIGADGKQSLAKDGTYPLMDGRKINVRNGKAIIDDN